MNYFAGIDNSSLDHKIRVIDENGKQNFAFSIPNSFNGFQELDNKLSSLSNPIIGFELPHGPIVDYLHSRKYRLYSLNPLKIKRFKESVKVSGDKNDYIDALAIAEYLRINAKQSKELIYNSSEIEKLKVLSIIHTRLTNDKARHLNKLHFSVSQYFPLMETLFADFGRTVQLKMIMTYPTYEKLRSASDDELKAFFVSNKYCQERYIIRIIERIRDHKQLIAPEIEYAYQIESQCLCKIIQTLDEELKNIEKQMNSLTDSHQLGKCFKSLPGAGKILSCKLLALFGDNKARFCNSNGAQCLFGTAPKNYQSGLYPKVIMRRACNTSARAILYKYAFSSIRFSSWAREYYDAMRKKGKSHSVAVRALSNKWVKVIFKIWKDEILYEESKRILSVA